jgi:hypothetical protein
MSVIILTFGLAAHMPEARAAKVPNVTCALIDSHDRNNKVSATLRMTGDREEFEVQTPFGEKSLHIGDLSLSFLLIIYKQPGDELEAEVTVMEHNQYHDEVGNTGFVVKPSKVIKGRPVNVTQIEIDGYKVATLVCYYNK